MLKFFHQSLLWIVALSILNTSIDINETFMHTAGDGNMAYAYNEIESILEIILDEATDEDGSLPDMKGNDQQSVLKKSVNFDITIPVKRERIPSLFLTGNIGKHNPTCDEDALPTGFLKSLYQPPDQA